MNLKEFAKRLSLSPTTVSRALSGYPEVSAATRQRVQEAARQFGYAPNQQATRLAKGVSMSIGHVLRLSTREILNPIFLEFMAGAAEVYARQGYDMTITHVEDGSELDTYAEIARRKSVDGMIVHGPLVGDVRTDQLAELGLPFLIHGRLSGTEDRFTWIDVNNQSAFKRATDLLLDLGHRRIAFLNGPETMDFAARRRAGYEAALAGRGVPVDPALMASRDMTEPYGAELAHDLLDRTDPPTAFLVSSIITAMGVARAAGERGIRLGHDISVVTHDDCLSFMPNDGEVPIFTCTRSSIRHAGQRSATLLIDLIAGRIEGPVSELLRAELILGRSTGPAPR